jgi:transposase
MDVRDHLPLPELKRLERVEKDADQAVMLWDGAGFHSSRQLRVPDNVTVATLPAYSPELNPIENLWRYLKRALLEQPGL